MTTKTPQSLLEQAEKLAQQAAEVQAQLDAQNLREYEQQQEEQRKAAQTLVDTFDAAALDQDVDNARALRDHHRLTDRFVPLAPRLRVDLLHPAAAARLLLNHAHLRKVADDLAAGVG